MSASARESTSRAGGWGSCCALSVPARPASMAGIDRDARLIQRSAQIGIQKECAL
jgi:hypothetical protein